MGIVELYHKCQDQLRNLGIELKPSNEGGFRGHYKSKYIMRLREGNQYFTINIKMSDGSMIGRKRIDSEQTLNKVFQDYLKPRIRELDV